MKIYLAAQFKEQTLMLQWREKLQSAGYIVTSRWLDVTDAFSTNEADSEANESLEDIDNSDIILSHTLNRGDLYTGGGRHIEFGYALAKGKILINVGGYESVFHRMSTTNTFKTLDEAINRLKDFQDT